MRPARKASDKRPAWAARLERHSGPVYLAIVACIEEAVSAGDLRPGESLPTHRDLARALGVNVGTVTRGYSEAKQRGLIGADRRRGSFIRAPGAGTPPRNAPIEIPAGFPPSRTETPGIEFDLTTTRPIGDLYATELARSLRQLGESPDTLAGLQGYYPSAGIPRHREAAAAWVGRSGLAADPARMLVCDGAQHGLAAALMAVARPGDLVLTEALTYGGVKVLASLLGLRLHGLPMDRDGLLPQALAAVCEAERPRALVCVPNLHNPTNAIMPVQRRHEIAEIAARHDLVVIEDDVYGALLEERLPPIAALAPELTFLVTSLSKSIAPGLRVGFLMAPERFVDRAIAGVRGTTWMASPIMAEIAARWIADGTGERLVRHQRTELQARQSLAAAVLTMYEAVGHPCSPQLWLRLPPTWRSDEFHTQARVRGVALMPAEVFAVGHVSAPQAARLNIGAARNRDELQAALSRLVELLASAPAPACLVA